MVGDERPAKKLKLCEYEAVDSVANSDCRSGSCLGNTELKDETENDKHCTTLSATSVRPSEVKLSRPMTLLDYFRKPKQQSAGHVGVKQNIPSTAEEIVVDEHKLCPAMRGELSVEESWEELQELVVFTSRGVQPSSKVSSV